MSSVKPKEASSVSIPVVLLLGLFVIAILDGLFEAHQKWDNVQQARSSLEVALDQKPEVKGFEGIWLQAKQLAYAHQKHDEFIYINYGIGWHVSPNPKGWMSYNNFKERIFYADNHDKFFRLFGGCLDTKIKSTWMASKNIVHIPLEDRGNDYDHFDDEAVYFFLCAAQRYDVMTFRDLWETEYTHYIVPKVIERADENWGLPALWRELHYDPLDRLDRATLEATLPIALKDRFEVTPPRLEEWATSEFRWQFNREPNQSELRVMMRKERANWQKHCREEVPKIRAERQRQRATVVELLRSIGDL